MKSLLVILGEFQSDFCENLTEFYQISLKIFGLSHRFQSTVYGMHDEEKQWTSYHYFLYLTGEILQEGI